MKVKEKKGKVFALDGKTEITLGAVISCPGSTKVYKTGEWRTYKPVIDQEKCIKCAKCWLSCPDAAVTRDSEGRYHVNYDYCKGCLLCERECPVKAISHKMEEK
jgi:pyruvate ferredoxin oxidoreductase delta subunit